MKNTTPSHPPPPATTDKPNSVMDQFVIMAFKSVIYCVCGIVICVTLLGTFALCYTCMLVHDQLSDMIFRMS